MLAFKAQNLIELGDLDGALAACDKAGGDPAYKNCKTFVYAKRGERAKVNEIYDGRTTQSAVNDFERSLAYSILNDRDKSFEALERLYRQRSTFVLYMTFPGFDNLRSDPRYADLVRRIGLPG